MMDQARRDARWRKRRIIYNNDGDDALYARDGLEHEHDVAEALTVRTAGELIDDFLRARSTPLIGSQVDSNWYASCMAGLTFSHNTKLGGFYGKELPLELIEKYGKDPLEVQLDFSRENAMEAVWALRMNDAHDAYPMGSRRWTYGLASFKAEHPECLMGEDGDWEKYIGVNQKNTWTKLDFSPPIVRDHIFGIIQEVAQNYDVDAIGMEFFKYNPFFRESHEGEAATPEHVEIMTDLLRRIRKMADEEGQKRGRPILLAAHTPPDLAWSRFIGLDLETWLADQLIDQLMPGGLSESVYCDSHSEMIELGHRHDIPVYPCMSWGFWTRWAYLDLSAGKHRTAASYLENLYGGQTDRLGKPSYILTYNGWKDTHAAWRGAAMNLLNDGADGLYIFNPALGEPEWWQDIGEVATMEGKDKLFGMDRFPGARGNVDQVELKQGEKVTLSFLVGEDPSAVDARLQFRAHLWDLTTDDEVVVELNGKLLSTLEVNDAFTSPEEGQWFEGDLTADHVVRGQNSVVLVLNKRAGSVQRPLLLNTIQLAVRY